MRPRCSAQTYERHPPYGYKSAGIGCSANLYGLFSIRPRVIGCHLSKLEGPIEEFYFEVARWNIGVSEWGLKAELGWPESKKLLVQVWDINEVVGWLIYQVDGEWQVDEFDATSQRTRNLAAALHLIADV